MKPDNITIKLYDKIKQCYVIPCEDEEYYDTDITYADGMWFFTGGNKIDSSRYEMEIIIE